MGRFSSQLRNGKPQWANVAETTFDKLISLLCLIHLKKIPDITNILIANEVDPWKLSNSFNDFALFWRLAREVQICVKRPGSRKCKTEKYQTLDELEDRILPYLENFRDVARQQYTKFNRAIAQIEKKIGHAVNLSEDNIPSDIHTAMSYETDYICRNMRYYGIKSTESLYKELLKPLKEAENGKSELAKSMQTNSVLAKKRKSEVLGILDNLSKTETSHSINKGTLSSEPLEKHKPSLYVSSWRNANNELNSELTYHEENLWIDAVGIEKVTAIACYNHSILNMLRKLSHDVNKSRKLKRTERTNSPTTDSAPKLSTPANSPTTSPSAPQLDESATTPTVTPTSPLPLR